MVNRTRASCKGRTRDNPNAVYSCCITNHRGNSFPPASFKVGARVGPDTKLSRYLKSDLIVEVLARLESDQVKSFSALCDMVLDCVIKKLSTISLTLMLRECAHGPDPSDRSMANSHHHADSLTL